MISIFQTLKSLAFHDSRTYEDFDLQNPPFCPGSHPNTRLLGFFEKSAFIFHQTKRNPKVQTYQTESNEKHANLILPVTSQELKCKPSRRQTTLSNKKIAKLEGWCQAHTNLLHCKPKRRPVPFRWSDPCAWAHSITNGWVLVDHLEHYVFLCFVEILCWSSLFRVVSRCLFWLRRVALLYCAFLCLFLFVDFRSIRHS